MDTNRRSWAKTLTWRLTGSAATLLIAYLLSSNWAMSGSIALTQLVANTLLYYLHERIWSRITWGQTGKAAADHGGQ